MHVFLGPTWHRTLIFGNSVGLGGSKKTRTFENGSEWSPGALGRVSGGPERASWAAWEGLWRS